MKKQMKEKFKELKVMDLFSLLLIYFFISGIILYKIGLLIFVFFEKIGILIFGLDKNKSKYKNKKI
jgi:hypothetical protein